MRFQGPVIVIVLLFSQDILLFVASVGSPRRSVVGSVLLSVIIEILVYLVLVIRLLAMQLSVLIHAGSTWLAILGAADGYVLLVTYDRRDRWQVRLGLR